MTKTNKIVKLTGKKKMRVAGLMSGTSADGVDAAIVDIGADGVGLLAFDTFAYPAAVRSKIFELFGCKSGAVADICNLNFVIGELFGDAVIKLCAKSGVKLSSLDLVGSHGQTIYHNARGHRFGKRLVRSTLQIGEAAVIAERTGVTTVADFRPGDMAANGEGAPLVPFADYVLFRDKRRSRAIQNIGGIANVTFLPAGCRPDDIIAFDTGPGNMIIDGLMSIISGGRLRYDRNGNTAAKGKVDEVLLGHMLRHRFLARRAPKSTGREEFGRPYCEKFRHKATERGMSGEDMVATATALTASSIAQAYRTFLPKMPDELILSGGGIHNRTLVSMLQDKLAGVKIRAADEFGISSDAKEAVCFAVLARATIKGITCNVPSATGADAPAILGKITLAK
jgi:anhydro-N-acetylmuramic acid kinase